MSTQLAPHLSFEDTARQAMEHYQRVFGGELAVGTYAEGHPGHDPRDADKVMHAMLTTTSGFVLMAADTPARMPRTERPWVQLALSGDDEPELRGYWDGLGDGGTVTAPLEPSPWGDIFGMVTDRFGVEWMVNISAPAA
ncbi:VOC family protein [Sanguibacter suaedae]|uniref:VOC family protein n=1 Tax=Sanguibacter suaedae TaxID=2795737 RepID=A0A934M9A1_9MICO|nr:VOC family protein [Sanguibacter suaedae]MBI9114433.1 VOC family protein [Sanguibacter suaedae]